MCGVAGRINFTHDLVIGSEIQKMLDLIKHRGPDDEGLLVKENIGIGHVRLSILDLSLAGHQPMFDNSGVYAISFNGEIYNYLELKSELEDFYTFKSTSDTEVILAAYLKWGKDCLHKFNGDWAFVIWHLPTGKIFGARDRYGIKPFYYVQNQKFFAFASESKALLHLTDREVDHQMMFDFLVYNRTDHTRHTFFKDVKKVPHGHCFTIADGQVHWEKWYDLDSRIKHVEPQSDQYYIDEFKRLFLQSIKLRLRSDVPVGLSLSGGLDSSSLLSSILDLDKEASINTFSAVYRGFDHADESRFIDLYKGQRADMHYVNPDGKTFFEDLAAFVKAHSEPVGGIGPYAQFKVMELAKSKVKVTLDGQGADESLTGYHYFFGSYFKELLNGLNIGRLSNELFHYQKKHGNSIAYTYWMLYTMPIRWKNKAVSQVNANLNSTFYKKYSGVSSLARDLYSPKNLNSSLYEHFQYKLEHLLKWDDQNAMNFSIESRVPFLDHNLVEFLLGVPSYMKISKGETKYILREAMKHVLPEQIRQRKDKKGYSTPSNIWFKEPYFKTYITNLLESKEFEQRGIFNVEACKSTYFDHLAGRKDYSREIWKWINVDLWYKHNIDQTL